MATQRGREVIHMLNGLEIVSDEAWDLRWWRLRPSPAPPTPPEPAPAFVNLVLAQAESQIPRDRIERGGLNVITTLDYRLAKSSRLCHRSLCRADGWSCRTETGLRVRATAAFASARRHTCGFICQRVDPRPEHWTGAGVGRRDSSRRGNSTRDRTQPGSSLDAFVYLTGFTRGLSPASLTWDIPSQGIIQNFDGEFHGPMRLRIALANDYQVPVETLKTQMGIENVTNIESSFGIDLNRACDPC